MGPSDNDFRTAAWRGGGRVTGPIVLDCDPGLDDAVALQYALGSGRYDLKAVTAVGGNAPVEHTYRNARALVKTFGVAGDVPVDRGVGGPRDRRGGGGPRPSHPAPREVLTRARALR